MKSLRFDDVDAANAIHEEDQPAIVDRDVIGGRALLAVCWMRQKMANLPRNERVRDVNEAQPLRKPRERDHGAVETLRWLVTTAHRRVRGGADAAPRPPARCDRHPQVLAGGGANTAAGGRR